MPALLIRTLGDREHAALRLAAAIAGETMDVFAAQAIRAAILRLAGTARGGSLAALLEHPAPGVKRKKESG